jgi:uncharacterized protein (DUF1501 family)
VRINGTKGTDHGTGSIALVLARKIHEGLTGMGQAADMM